MAKELRTYTILKGIANNLSQPFISFTAVSSGILGEYLGLISSASTFFTALAQFISALLRTRAKSLLLWAESFFPLICFVGHFRIIQKFINNISSITHGKE
ncbi:hypothetical protein MetMK1DRAFT_00003360 [Metallosphaera yellowstonensis MK1]|uniref:Uncharacterized protein n=1 Tax=Metallosphaera yellowstonensis MK1 TaxID=671065 RepID=H2C4P2_9CREN|nr:hypothetical protein [Metallosphaera yellowstonensis]EHP69834.1 hypothetical protein MetMK1DRAFT_00003360 [Metallosphaera yellowstonensis MK1]